MTKLLRMVALLVMTVAVVANISCSPTGELNEDGSSSTNMSKVDPEERLNDVKMELDNLNIERDKLNEVRDNAIAERESYWEFSGSIFFDSEYECEEFLQDLSEGKLSYMREGDKSYPIRPIKPFDCESYLSLGVESANATRKLRALGEREGELRAEMRKVEADVRIQEEAKRAAEAERKRMASKDKERVLALKEIGGVEGPFGDWPREIESWEWIEWRRCRFDNDPLLGYVSAVEIRGPERRVLDIWVFGRDVCG